MILLSNSENMFNIKRNNHKLDLNVTFSWDFFLFFFFFKGKGMPETLFHLFPTISQCEIDKK